MKKIATLAGLLLFTLPAFSQNVSPEAAVQAALQRHPLARAAVFDVQAKKYAEKGTFNLPNPQVNAESPTGEFYAVGVSQSFAFPTVYARQKQVARAETALARAGQQLSENDLRYTVRSLYLDVQIAQYQSRQSTERDSLYQLILSTAVRQFAGGEIDFLQKTLIENEAGQVRVTKEAFELQSTQLQQQLLLLTGLNAPLLLPLLVPDTTALRLPDTAGDHPAVAYERQAAVVAAQQVRLAKARSLPDFSLGYLNQGPRSTPAKYRFRASIGIPLWTGQYRAGIQSAQAESLAASARAEARSQSIALDLQRARGEALTALNQVQYFEREALPRSRSLISAALRLRQAGQVDYVTFLRTLDAAYAIPRDYAVQLQSFETARLKMLYLQGQ